MKKLHIFIFLFCYSSSIFSQMSVNDPQSWWGDSPASIENVEIDVRVVGLYHETSIAFDVLLEDEYSFWSNELLEFVFDFEMSEKAIFNDSWLWINDYISEGEIYEQGKGTQIYESIVDRQQDPSILTQVSTTDYNLKIYPLKWDSTRRVRLSYLEPLNYNGRDAYIDLPLHIINYSEVSPENVSIKIFNDEGFDLSGLPSEDWTLEETNGDSKLYKYIYDPSTALNTNAVLNIESDDPPESIALSTYQDGADNYYQLLYYPETVSNMPGQYHMILLDYAQNTSDLSYDEVIENLKSSMSNLRNQDYFIICYSDFVTQFSSEDWTPATSENRDEALTKVSQVVPFYNNYLSSLLPEALAKIESLGQESSLVVTSTSTDYYMADVAEGFLDLLMGYYGEMNTPVKVSTIDCANDDPWANIDGSSYFGNEYLYKRLTSQTSGKYFDLDAGHDLNVGFESIFSTVQVHTDQYEFDISIDNGFTYSSYIDIDHQYLLGDTKPIVAVGKYLGDGPFKVEFKYYDGNQIATDVKEVTPSISTQLDETAISIWNARLIQSLQNTGSDEVRQQVVETSIYERLLSLHTVFLCLEPDFESISANNNNEDGIIITSTNETPKEATDVKVFPNPFVEELTIEFPIHQISEVEYVVISILDSDGQLIEKIVESNGLTEGKNSIRWSPSSDLKDAIYVIQIQMNEVVYSQKVLHLSH